MSQPLPTIAETPGDIIALFTREQAPLTFKPQYPKSQTQGDVADDFTTLPSFYAVSEDKMLLFGLGLAAYVRGPQIGTSLIARTAFTGAELAL